MITKYDETGSPVAAPRLPGSDISRRQLIAAIGIAASAPLATGRVFGQSPALPLDNLGLEHLDILVPDTAASARFYMQVFDTALHEQPFRGSIRYFILLGDLPEDRQVGYIAIGAAGDRPVQIGHYCALAESYDRDAWRRRSQRRAIRLRPAASA